MEANGQSWTGGGPVTEETRLFTTLGCRKGSGLFIGSIKVTGSGQLVMLSLNSKWTEGGHSLEEVKGGSSFRKEGPPSY